METLKTKTSATLTKVIMVVEAIGFMGAIVSAIWFILSLTEENMSSIFPIMALVTSGLIWFQGMILEALQILVRAAEKYLDEK